MMNRNLFLRELRSNAVSLLIWTSVITALTALTMSFYGVFPENNEKILAMISIIPEGTLQFKGISDVDDLFSVLGFYSANNVIYMLVLGSIYSIVLSSGILLREEYNKTAEFLLSWPLSRAGIFFSKADHHAQHRAGTYPLFHLHDIEHHGGPVTHRLRNPLQVRWHGHASPGIQARVQLFTLFWRSVIASDILRFKIVQAQRDLSINLINK